MTERFQRQSKWDALPDRWRLPLKLAVVAVVYVIAFELAYFITGPGATVAAIWPASGVALAAMLLSSRKEWIAILITVSVANFLVWLASGHGFVKELGYLAANTAETGLSAWVITRLNPRPITFARIGEVASLVLATLVVNGISALLGAAAAGLTFDHSFSSLYLTWWTADGLGILLITPLIIGWLRPDPAMETNFVWPRILEALGAIAAALLLAWFFLGPAHEESFFRPHSYMLFAPAIWAALRLGVRGTATVLFLAAVMEIGITAFGGGRFPLGGETAIEHVRWVQLFIATKCSIALLLAASFAERKAIERSLRASDEKFSKLYRSSPVAIVLTRQADGRLVDVNAALERFVGYRRDEMIGRTTVELGLWQNVADRKAIVDELAKSNVVECREIAFVTKQGTPAYAQYSAEVIDVGGEHCVLSVMADVTARKDVETELRRVNRALRTISNCNQVLVRATDERQLFNEICQVIVEHGGHNMAWVGYVHRGADRTIELAGQAGIPPEVVKDLRLTWSGVKTDCVPSKWAIEHGKVAVCHDFLNDPQVQNWRELAIALGFRSSVALPLRLDGKVACLLAIYSGDPHAFDEQELKLLTELADDLAFGIGALRARMRHELSEAEVRNLLDEAERSRSALLSILEDQKLSEEALRQSEERMRSAMHDSAIGLGLISPEGKWLEVNPMLCRILGYTREELLKLNFRDISHPDDRTANEELVDKLMRREALAGEFEKRYVHKDGHIIWVQINGSLVWNPDGTPRHFVCQIQDVTERKRSQKALLEVNERYARHEAALSTLSRNYAVRPEEFSTLLRQIAEVLASTLATERVSIWTYNNSRSSIVCLELFERSKKLHSQGIELSRAGHEAYFDAMDNSDVIVADNALTDARTQSFAVDYLKPLGICSMLDVPLHARSGITGVLCCEHVGPARQWTPDEQTFAVAVANLVSMFFAQLEQQRLEAQLRQTQKLESLGTLAGGIAHDFNNILGAIISFTELSRMDHPEDAELQENLGEVLKASHRAAGLVRQILAFSRQQRHERQHIQLAPIVREVLKLIRSTLPSTIELEVDLAPDLPAVFADPTQIHQVIMNLCTNAGHAMRGKAGILRVSLGPTGRLATSTSGGVPSAIGRGPNVMMTVSDNGHGMDAATVDRIFDPFFTTKDPGEGTGLGLAVVHGIIEEHEGKIEVESEPGVGTTFRVILPASEKFQESIAEDTLLHEVRATQRVMFVDDERPLGESARLLLKRYGFEVEVFVRPDEALRRFMQDPGRFEAVITDLTMPRMTGTELASRILERQPDLPVFLMTGFAGAFSSDAAKNLGIAELVVKPLDYALLAHKIADAIGSRHVQRNVSLS
ncbi:PAS domain S-box protein [bacterium]|nr:PAS domain S-box protein [bacterium]